MLFDQMVLQLGVTVEAGLKRHLPFLPGSELAVVPESGDNRPENLGAGGTAGLDCRACEGGGGVTCGRGCEHENEVGHILRLVAGWLSALPADSRGRPSMPW